MVLIVSHHFGMPVVPEEKYISIISSAFGLSSQLELQNPVYARLLSVTIFFPRPESLCWSQFHSALHLQIDICPSAVHTQL